MCPYRPELAAQSFGYDAASRLSTLTNNLGGSATTHDLTQTFTYNPASQIQSVARSNDAYAWQAHYNVDRAYVADGLNRIMNAGGFGYTYDARGNLTNDGSRSFTYTSENLLKTGPASSTLGYDPLGRLYQTVGGGTTTRFEYDGVDLIAEYNGSNAVQRRYVHGPGIDNPIAWYEGSAISNATRRFLMADERGSVVSITDSAGATININAYDEYGIPAPGNVGRFGYTGQTWLPELGMWYYKARIYSPTLGRFMQTDPIGYRDGMNWYNYVGSDPVNFSDPLGLCTQVGDGNGGWLPPENCPTPFNWDDYAWLKYDLVNDGVSTGSKGTGGGGQTQGPDICGKSTLDTLIGAASTVGGFLETVGDVGTIVGGAVAFVNPALGGGIMLGSKVVGGVGTAVALGAAAADAYQNGNAGNLTSMAGEKLAGVAFGGAFNVARKAEYAGRVANVPGAFRPHFANKYGEQIDQSASLLGSKAVGSQVCQ